MGSNCSSRRKADTISLDSEDSQEEEQYGAVAPADSPQQSVNPPKITENELSSGGGGGGGGSVPLVGGARMEREHTPTDDLPNIGLLYDQWTTDLLQGNIDTHERKTTLKRVCLCLLGDHNDTEQQKLSFVEQLGGLREDLDKHGLELIILNPNLGNLFPEFPISQIDSILNFIDDIKSCSMVMNILFLNQTTGALSLPKVLDSLHVEQLSQLPDVQDILHTWYAADLFAKDVHHALQFPVSFQNELKNCQLQDYSKLLSSVREEAAKHAASMATLFNKVGVSIVKTPMDIVVSKLIQDKHPNLSMLWIERTIGDKDKISKDSLCLNDHEQNRLEALRQSLGDRVSSGNKFTYEYSMLEQKETASAKHIAAKACQRIKEIITSFGLLRPVISRNVQDGVKIQLRQEIENHLSHCRHLASLCLERDAVLDDVRKYVLGDSRKALLLHGSVSCGLSSLMAKVAVQCSSWLPKSSTIVRFVGLTNNSSIPEALNYYIYEHCLLLYGDANLFWTPQDISGRFQSLLTRVTAGRPLVIVIDGVNHLDHDLPFLCQSLPCNVKLILSTAKLKPLPPITDKIHVENLGQFGAKKCLASQMDAANRYLSDIAWASAKAHTYSNFDLSVLVNHILIKQDHNYPSTSDSATHFIECLQPIFMKEPLKMALVCLSESRLGLTDSELLGIFQHHMPDTCESTLDFTRFSALARPFLARKQENGITMSTWSCCDVKLAVDKLYLNSTTGAQYIRDHILKMNSGVPLWNMTFVNHPTTTELSTVRMLQAASSVEVKLTGKYSFIFNADWLLSKTLHCGPFKVLDDVMMASRIDNDNEDLKLLKEFLLLAAQGLDYEPTQLYTQLYLRLRWKIASKADLKYLPALIEQIQTPSQPSLISLSPCLEDSLQVPLSRQSEVVVDGLFHVNNPDHIITISTNSGQLTLWDIMTMTPVRTLSQLNHPLNVKMVDDKTCVVLCDRELRVYDLDEGRFLLKLPEVMNQKNPFYGICMGANVVALSRSRMYLNMMELERGTCVTTFKVGEARFLSSLMVSANGTICVCVDEKPPAVVVWNLEEKKLMYELKMINHEYIPLLSAITDDGHYASCVCKEIDEPAPNFIVVYELQSGTICKRWKPDVNTISMIMSTAETIIVIIGLEDCTIMAYDLIVGNPLWTVQGHTAPADTLKVDKNGTVLLSYDSTGRDRSIRVWNLLSGQCIASLTPDHRIRCCELTSKGNGIVLSMEGQAGIHTLMLCHNQPVPRDYMSQEYANPAHKGKVFTAADKPEYPA